MGDIPKIEKGDKVRIVIEGEARYVGTGGFVDIGTAHTILPSDSTVVELHVTPKPKPLKVGDVVSRERLWSVPLGTVLTAYSGNDKPTWVRAGSGWINLNTGDFTALKSNWDSRTIVSLPTQES